ncbi:hypothetical protein R69746_08400 [Paraburkholderia aspalathi]|uniref:hypothetical protein n=1 Tax=Paraburkholderia aspalathi TaxID=1324617 RepID=UPI00190C999D|nr:hypothetical protein [Paraburkholderia aspalathi]MBK3844297.1 hypothetical protein [Paraburkholderia aspalathi]CAE6870675.1 hypothetical protein R69746_08400 [Paraburkholderia aspalathi]
MDLNRTHSTSPPASPNVASADSGAPHDAQTTEPSRSRPSTRSGVLEQIPNRGGATRARDEASTSAVAERPRKKLRFASDVTAFEPHDVNAAQGSLSADDNQEPIAALISANRRAFVQRQARLNQPSARALQSGLGAEIARYLPTRDQVRLGKTMIGSPQDRYELLARLLPPHQRGVYLARDPNALAYANEETSGGERLSGDTLVDRASWLLEAASGASVPPTLRARVAAAATRAEERLLQHFDQALPHTRAEAVRRLINASALAETLSGALRLARIVLSPDRFHALPAAERPRALASLVGHIEHAAHTDWSTLDEESSDAESELDGTGAAAHAARRADLAELHARGLDDMLPLALGAARRAGTMPAALSLDLAQSIIALIDRGTPSPAAQVAALDLVAMQLQGLQGNDREDVLAELTQILARFSEPDDQRRVLRMLTTAPGNAPDTPGGDRLWHVGAEGRSAIAGMLVDQLRHLPHDGVRDDVLNLLANQFAPERLSCLEPYRLRAALVSAAALAVDPGHQARLFAIVAHALDALPTEHLAAPLIALFESATEMPDAVLAGQMHETWRDALPRVPVGARGNVLAEAVATLPPMLPVALYQFTQVSTADHEAMLSGIQPQAGEAFANILLGDAPEAAAARDQIVFQVLASLPAAQQGVASALLAATLAWAATTTSPDRRDAGAQAARASVMQILADTPVPHIATVLSAFFARIDRPLLPAAAASYLRTCQASGAAPFHTWLAGLPMNDRSALAIGLARSIGTTAAAPSLAAAVDLADALHRMPLEESASGAILQALIASIAVIPGAYAETLLPRTVATLDHGLRELPTGPQHTEALRVLAAALRSAPAAAWAEGAVELPQAMRVLERELPRAVPEDQARVLAALRGQAS